MKTIVAGSRSITDYNIVKKAIEDALAAGFVITEVVSGNANGVDKLGERWAKENNIPCKIFKADWDGLGKAAGPIRNEQMARYAEQLIIVWDGISRGSGHMKKTAAQRKFKIHELIYRDE